MMAGTTEAIARLLRDRSLTTAECVAALGLSREQLVDRLCLMERQGYVARIVSSDPDGPCTCRHCCSTCCRKNSVPGPAVFTLTPKGERLAGDSGGA